MPGIVPRGVRGAVVYVVLMFLRSFWEYVTDLWSPNGNSKQKTKMRISSAKAAACRVLGSSGLGHEVQASRSALADSGSVQS